ncbi:MFS transporter [Nocardioides sp. STR2]|uniref:MFS transporter n=1 Tax=Nocardioides pini TaxID=2975053 RepID=A0ABT4CJJ8_9ACTN|nr:MFS transporter [Nocardioides pini]MCY4728576.1 MFS transporter [Nocardioides pini]
MPGPAHRDDGRALGTDPVPPSRVGWSFIALYALSYTGGSLLFLAPLLVSLALKVRDLVGADAAPGNLALVAGTGSLLSIIANPLFGRLSDRTTSRWGMRRPWMVTGVAVGAVGTMVIATAPDVGTVLLGWCLCQVFFNATLAAQTAVLADQVPTDQRGVVAGVLGLAVPIASVTGTYLVQLFDHSTVLMFAVPCAVGGVAVLLFAWRLTDRRLDGTGKPPWSLRELAATFYVSPRSNADFAWAFLSRFLLVTAYAFLVTFQTFFLLEQIGSAEDAVPRQVYLGTVAQSVALVIVAPVAGRISDRVGRRKVFVTAAAIVYAGALFVIAASTSVNGYLVGMAIGGVGFGMYMAVDLALVVDVLADPLTAAKDLGVLNIAGALPFALAPTMAPAILALGGGSYAVLYAVAGACALGGALAVAPIKNVR